MSDNWIIFASSDPDWTPSERRTVEDARAILKVAFPSSDGIEYQVYDHYQFVWNGENFEGVNCPFCKESADEWWGDSIPDFDNSSSFGDLEIVTPCCSKRTDLNSLDYPEPVAFAKFEISIMNPDDPRNLSGVHGVAEMPPGLKQKLESCLRTDLTVVRRRL